MKQNADYFELIGNLFCGDWLCFLELVDLRVVLLNIAFCVAHFPEGSVSVVVGRVVACN